MSKKQKKQVEESSNGPGRGPAGKGPNAVEVDGLSGKKLRKKQNCSGGSESPNGPGPAGNSPAGKGPNAVGVDGWFEKKLRVKQQDGPGGSEAPNGPGANGTSGLGVVEALRTSLDSTLSGKKSKKSQKKSCKKSNNGGAQNPCGDSCWE
ncbi:hypothetical protein [Fictibacillus phosphorivorans]|uniref:hypothetical protein n=1 Tax=Fictibacillus phosphorivorans TaxID=1221500 RepID=UPI00203D9151|nr:hypothetical protein [Fictibacillus phosphorivorans]MCM3720038.1 hypothetical protein [Fictibacillus phosphorivorans]MCM3777692.1 hypothetical protein [Fictibacillus phosphorivorans]